MMGKLIIAAISVIVAILIGFSVWVIYL